MRKVLLFSANFPEYTIELANGLSAHCEVVLTLPANRITSKHVSLISEKVKYRPFTLIDYKSIRANFRMLKEIAQIIRTTKPDIIHLQAYGLSNFWWLLPLMAGRKLVNTIHDPLPHSGDQVSQHNKWNQSLINKRCAAIIVHGESLKNDAIQHLGISTSKLYVIPHGHLGVYKHWRTQTYQCEPNTFLFFGRIWPYKGLQYFIEAANLLTEQRKDVRFIIAGSGEPIDRYVKHIKHPELFEIRNYRIPEEEIDELFQRACFTVLPYTDATQSGVIPIALAYGVTVIASRVGSLGEVITHRQTGYLIPPKDTDALHACMTDVLENPQDDLHEQSSKLCQTALNWENIAGQTLLSYRNIYRHSAL